MRTWLRFHLVSAVVRGVCPFPVDGRANPAGDNEFAEDYRADSVPSATHVCVTVPKPMSLSSGSYEPRSREEIPRLQPATCAL